MKPYDNQFVLEYINKHIEDFHTSRIECLDRLDLNTILKKKNPYLFRAKGFDNATELVNSLVNAFLSSNEETLFGEWLEQLAIHINSQVYNGRKSGIQGIDLEFDKDDTRYIVSIKSGPNWGNSSQINKMKEDFERAKRTLKTSGSRLHIEAVNGCCYGKDNAPFKKGYQKLCGQRFWYFISGELELYQALIIPLSKNAKQRNEDFTKKLGGKITNFVVEFANDFCCVDGTINWNVLTKFNSGIE